MREFDFIKVPGSAFNSSNQAWQIRSIHQHANVKMIIAEVYDQELAEHITKFLNSREKVLEEQRLARMNKTNEK